MDSLIPYEPLRWQYQDLPKKQREDTFAQQDALDLLVVVSQLGSMGYILDENGTDWFPPSAEN